MPAEIRAFQPAREMPAKRQAATVQSAIGVRAHNVLPHDLLKWLVKFRFERFEFPQKSQTNCLMDPFESA